MSPAHRIEGVTLRRAAVITGFAYLLSPVSYAEFTLMPKLVVPGKIEQTVQNLIAHKGLFVAALLCYLITFLWDVVAAWGLYVLLAPVNRAVALLTAWFRLVYTAVVLVAFLNLVTVFRLLDSPDDLKLFGAGPLNAQIHLLLGAFRSGWSMSLVVFAIHLILLGCLIYRSGYIPKLIGILLVIDGVGWMVDCLQPYLYPNAQLGFIFATFFGELIFMLWLLIRGWKIPEPIASS